LKKGISILPIMPEKILWQSFRALSNFEYHDYKSMATTRLIRNIRKYDSFDDVVHADNKESDEIGVKDFKNSDDFTSKAFIDGIVVGNQDLKLSFKENPDREPFIVKDKVYKVDTHECLADLLTKEPMTNVYLSILRFADHFMSDEVRKAGITHAITYASYDHGCDIFMTAYSKSVALHTINKDTPGKNEINDLLHLLYLPPPFNTKVVSDDKIYDSVCPGVRIPVNELKTKPNATE
jgi:hypothetical protein